MVDERGQEVLVNGVDDVKEELSFGSLLGEELIREESPDMLVISDHVEHLEDTQLFDDRYGDEIHLADTEDLLISGKDFFDKVLVIVALSWQVILAL